jgi:choline dehydrogenase
LRALGIPVIAERPGVGDVLLDHPAIGLPGLAADGVTHDNDVVVEIGVRFTAAGSPESNDMQLVLATLFDPELTRAFLPEPMAMYSVGPALYRPRSTGRLTLATPDPTHQPVLELNYLADPFDLARMVEALRLARDLCRSPDLAELTGPLLVDDATLDDDHAIAEHLRSEVTTTYHPAGTAPMGLVDDDRSVVDSHGRVHGIEGLRVVDASIMPTSVRCNTNITCIMLAERIASWMRDGD